MTGFEKTCGLVDPDFRSVTYTFSCTLIENAYGGVGESTNMRETAGVPVLVSE